MCTVGQGFFVCGYLDNVLAVKAGNTEFLLLNRNFDTIMEFLLHRRCLYKHSNLYIYANRQI